MSNNIHQQFTESFAQISLNLFGFI